MRKGPQMQLHARVRESLQPISVDSKHDSKRFEAKTCHKWAEKCFREQFETWKTRPEFVE